MKAAPFAILLIAAAATAPPPALSATVASTYAPLGGNSWLASFSVTNDGTPASIGGFTIFFLPTRFSGLVLAASPATWDSIVIQPDTALASAGFLDSFARTSGASLVTGASVGGFQVRFNVIGGGTPGALNFVINDANYNVLFSGMTSVALVPEPPAWALASAAAVLLAAGAGLRRRVPTAPAGQATQEEQAA